MLPYNQGLLIGVILGFGMAGVGFFTFIGLEYLIWRQNRQNMTQVLDPEETHMGGHSQDSERQSQFRRRKYG